VEIACRNTDYFLRQDMRLAGLRAWLLETLRGRERLTLEIGCGHGHFLNGYAAAHPQTFALGLDLLAERVARASKKRDRARLPNLAFVQAEARELLGVLPPEVALADIFILFPDPWPKRRHHKNRLMGSELLSALAARASEEARLFFRTDYAPYFAEARAVVAGHRAWQLVEDEAWPFEVVTVFQQRATGFQSLIAKRRRAEQ
jgi:tRNA (guanine-N7-)-methyltransferase